MLYARECSPSIQKGLADEMIFDAGRVEGYRQALDTFSEIIAAEQKKDQPLENT